jgi:hypothetical protein
MKTHPFNPLFLAAAGLAASILTSCSRDADADARARQATIVAAPVPVAATQVQAAPAAVPLSVVVNPDASATWSGMRDLPFEQRSAFLAGLGRLSGIVDSEIGTLNTRRAGLTSDTKDWDFAMKGLLDDQAYLKSLSDEVSRATPDSWAQVKERVEAAWQATQDAYDKVLHSTAAVP